jgi:thiol:disulfide interchange protein
MKLPNQLAILFAFAVVATIMAPPLQAQKHVKESGLLAAADATKDLYPTAADARKEIDDAVKHAATVHKRVLLVFGGNWCYDCHALDQALHEGSAGKIMKDSFVLVHVDIGEADKNLDLTKKYNIPLEKGVPAIAVLNGNGELLYSSGDGEFEAARVMMKKDLIAFLDRWKLTKVE